MHKSSVCAGWVLGYAPMLVTQIPSNIDNFYLHPRSLLCAPTQSILASTQPPEEPLSDLFPLRISFSSLLKSCVSRTTSFVLFHIKLLSLSTVVGRSIPVVAFFLLLSCILLYDYASACLSIFYCSQFQAIIYMCWGEDQTETAKVKPTTTKLKNTQCVYIHACVPTHNLNNRVVFHHFLLRIVTNRIY